MTLLLVALLLLALAAVLFAAGPAVDLAEPRDRDRERLLADLRAMPGYRADVPLGAHRVPREKS